MNNEQIIIDVFGTCYSREIFNVTKKYKVNTYLMQQSIYTLFENPLKIYEKDTKTYDGYKFKHRMIFYEFNKFGLKKLSEKPAKYILIDLTDMARNVLSLNNLDNVKVIETKETLLTLEHLKKKIKFKDITSEVIDVNRFTDEELKRYISEFVIFLLKIYDEENIILNRVKMQLNYYENGKKKKMKEAFPYTRKELIRRVEEIFISLLPKCKILSTNFEPVVDINHKLGGPHCMHFEQLYYRYEANLLNAIINNLPLNIVDEQYKEDYKKSINQIKNKSKIL